MWTCGASATPPPPVEADAGPGRPDDGALVDSASTDGGGHSREVTFCAHNYLACNGEDPVASAETALKSLMTECGAYCTQLTLFSNAESGCAIRLVANVEWTAGALDCLVTKIGQHRWDCASEYRATTGSCPD